MAEKKEYVLEVHYPLEAGWQNGQKVITEALGIGHPNCSGAGFGVRDMAWHRLSKAKCDELAPILKGLTIEGLEYSFAEDEGH